ncbi:MAG: hypothetical protein AAF699_18370, partial [Pseudomonadota bacterium]
MQGNEQDPAGPFWSWLSSSSPTEWLSAVAAIVVAWAALRGLKGWYSYIGQKKYDAASELRTAVLGYRDALKDMRYAARRTTDYSNDAWRDNDGFKKEFEIEDRDERAKAQMRRLANEKYRAEMEVYSTRARKVGGAYRRFEDALFKAEVA